MSSESRSHRPWFQDCRSGCEKQTHYFVRIRKLQDELINREQHNLINAMERLRQISNPRRRTGLAEDSFDLPRSSQSFPSRSLNLRKQAKHKPIPKYGKPDLKPVSGKPLIPEREKKTGAPSIHPFFTLPLLTDTDIAKIVHNASYGFSREPSTYLLQPHLPSIPNVGRKANFVLDNRLRLLTLAGSDPEFCEGSVTGTTKKIHKGKSKKSEGQDDSGKKPRSSGTKKRSQSEQVLRFDIDLNDPSIFTHRVDDLEDVGEAMSTPLPPPNSRPSSTKLRVGQSHEDIDVNKDKIVDNPEEEISLGQDGAQLMTGDALAAVTTEESSVEKNDPPGEVMEQMNEEEAKEQVVEELGEKGEPLEETVELQTSAGQDLTGNNAESDIATEDTPNNKVEDQQVTEVGKESSEETTEQQFTSEDQQPEEDAENRTAEEPVEAEPKGVLGGDTGTDSQQVEE